MVVIVVLDALCSSLYSKEKLLLKSLCLETRTILSEFVCTSYKMCPKSGGDFVKGILILNKGGRFASCCNLKK